MAIDRRGHLGRRGWDLGAELRRNILESDESGRTVIRSEEVNLRGTATGGVKPARRLSAHQRGGEGLAPLPVGSRLDPGTGVFTWAPGVGFVGALTIWYSYTGTPAMSQRVAMSGSSCSPKAAGSIGPQVVIDAPAVAAGHRAQPFMLAGWAADLNAVAGDGYFDVARVGLIRWPEAPPVFLGAAEHRRRGDLMSRPCTASNSGAAGLRLNVKWPAARPLRSDVFPWSTVTGGFAPPTRGARDAALTQKRSAVPSFVAWLNALSTSISTSTRPRSPSGTVFDIPDRW